MHVYIEALDLINQKGWWDGKSVDTSGECIALAIQHQGEDVDGRVWWATPEGADRLNTLCAHLIETAESMGWPVPQATDNDPYLRLTRWNDEPGRTKDHVLQLLAVASDRYPEDREI